MKNKLVGQKFKLNNDCGRKVVLKSSPILKFWLHWVTRKLEMDDFIKKYTNGDYSQGTVDKKNSYIHSEIQSELEGMVHLMQDGDFKHTFKSWVGSSEI